MCIGKMSLPSWEALVVPLSVEQYFVLSKYCPTSIQSIEQGNIDISVFVTGKQLYYIFNFT